jgi:hypothetical protein
MKKITLLLALIVSVLGFAQSKDINDYKYVIMPDHFEFLKETDQYNLNTLTRKIFENKGFEVYYNTEKDMPTDLRLNQCLALYGDLVLDSGMLSTGITIVLKDCKGNVVFTSVEGKSKIKELKKAYYEALREASRSFDIIDYRYNDGGPAVTAASTSPAIIAEKQKKAENQLIARPTASGYELLYNSQKVVLKMFKTSQPDYYSAQMEDINGVVFKKGSEWVFEYYLNDKPVSQKLNIKF